MKYLYITILVLLVSCGQTKTDEVALPKKIKLKDKTVKFLWREDKYDEELKDTFSTIIINEKLCKTLTEPEIAALGYVVTYIGSECQWDGKYNEDRSNLKCKALDALNLGYQCSDKHLGLLRKWFKNDTKVLEELNYCPTTPFTASSQETFDEITLTTKGDKISVWFGANGVNMPMGESWYWTETDYFQLDNDNIKLIKKDKSKVEHEHFDNTGE